MVEMAVVAPLFFMLILGIIEFGRAFMVSEMMINASREAVRLAIIPGTMKARYGIPSIVSTKAPSPKPNANRYRIGLTTLLASDDHTRFSQTR